MAGREEGVQLVVKTAARLALTDEGTVCLFSGTVSRSHHFVKAYVSLVGDRPRRANSHEVAWFSHKNAVGQ